VPDRELRAVCVDLNERVLKGDPVLRLEIRGEEQDRGELSSIACADIMAPVPFAVTPVAAARAIRRK